MPLTGKSAAEISDLETQFLNGVPDDETSIGNKRLRDEVLGWDSDLYLAVRKRLLDAGSLMVGRGKGGSVRRLIEEAAPEPQQPTVQAVELAADPFPDELSLYIPVIAVIRNRWIQDQPFDQVLVEQTDRGGRRKDGIWTRPDVTVAAMTSYTYVPGRHFDIITFEIKHHSGFNVTAVYEALAHRRAAMRSYVFVYIPDDLIDTFENPTLVDISDEASKHGIGLIVASDPNDFDTWDIREDAVRVIPDPARLNAFIRNQLSDGSRDQIVRWFRV